MEDDEDMGVWEPPLLELHDVEEANRLSKPMLYHELLEQSIELQLEHPVTRASERIRHHECNAWISERLLLNLIGYVNGSIHGPTVNG